MQLRTSDSKICSLSSRIGPWSAPRRPTGSEVLLETVLAVGTGLDLPSVLRAIVQGACRFADARYGALGVVGSESHLIEFVTSGRPRDTRQCELCSTGGGTRRVGVSGEALPAILPVTIAVMDQSVIFRTIPGTKLAHAAAGSILAIEADHYDTSERRGWSVLVRGVASELLDEHDITRARERLTDWWIDRQTAEHYVNVSCDLVTGRRLDHPTPDTRRRRS